MNKWSYTSIHPYDFMAYRGTMLHSLYFVKNNKLEILTLTE